MRQRGRQSHALRLATTLIVASVLLVACGVGQDRSSSGQIVWIQGTRPAELAQAALIPPTLIPTQAPTSEAVLPVEVTAGPPTLVAPPTPTHPLVASARLTTEELATYQPNELGTVPVLMYHNIVAEYEPGQQGDVLWRTADELHSDLQWLYDQNFYVVTMREYSLDIIAAPAGKHPVVLTFDDSRPNQFYYDFAADGTPMLDPNSAVGVLEDFFAAHPDFGHTALFAILPVHCFDFEEPAQTPYCQQKLQLLVDHGYEVANHTWDHQDLGDISTELFEEKVGDTLLWLQEQVGQVSASDILILPYGVFPGGVEAERQWDEIRQGFDYQSQRIALISVLAAGAEPAPSPANLSFDPMSIARIGAKNQPSPGESDLFLDYWFEQFVERPELFYTSDGNPDTITVPQDGPPEYAGALDADKVAAEGKEVIWY